MMSTMQTWSIWWDFLWEEKELKYVIVETNHPRYRHLPYIFKFPISECLQDDTIDNWERTWFRPFVDDIMSGRKSIHKIMKSLEKQKNQKTV